MNIHPLIENLVPYRPGRPISSVQKEFGLTRVIKLASNENPLGPSPLALEALKNALSDLHFYPDPSSRKLVEKISQHFGISALELALGNGSDELFDQLIRIFCNPEESILVSKGAFSAYPISAQAARVKAIEVPLKSNFEIDLEAFSKILSEKKETEKIRLVFLPNPNNPTGILLDPKELKKFLSKWAQDPNLLIVLDEAYHEFVRDPRYVSGLIYRKEFKRLIVSRTFSKAYGLAGLRVGFIACPTFVVDYLNRVRKPFNINLLAQVAAYTALDDVQFIHQVCHLTWSELDRIYLRLQEMGVNFIQSSGNFYMLETKRDIKDVERFFLEQGVIIRPVDNYGFKTWIRISVGLPDENEAALSCLKSCFETLPVKDFT